MMVAEAVLDHIKALPGEYLGVRDLEPEQSLNLNARCMMM